jgi:hypothetical protein
MQTLIQTSSRVLGGALLFFGCTSCIVNIGKSLDASADPVPSKPAKRTESMKEKEYVQKIAKLSRRIGQNPRERSPTLNSTALRKATEIGHKLKKI